MFGLSQNVHAKKVSLNQAQYNWNQYLPLS